MNCVLITYGFWTLRACSTFWAPFTFRPLCSRAFTHSPPNQSQQLQNMSTQNKARAICSNIKCHYYYSTTALFWVPAGDLWRRMTDGGQWRKERAPSCLLCLSRGNERGFLAAVRLFQAFLRHDLIGGPRSGPGRGEDRQKEASVLSRQQDGHMREREGWCDGDGGEDIKVDNIYPWHH